MSTSEELGFRICGIRCYQPWTDSYVVKDKPWGTNVKADMMLTDLKIFLHNGNQIRYKIVKAMLPMLFEIREYFRNQTNFKFYGSSLLFVYDGANPNAKVLVKMVDFAHTNFVKDEGRDESYICGIDNVIKFFEALVAEGETHATGEAHDFKLVYFMSPTFCTHCNKFIWGVSSKQGYKCQKKGCEFTAAHKHCHKLIANNCRGKNK